jgi:SAM-dependent methyltransferase
MTDMADGVQRAHWEGVYGSKSPDEVSWHQGRPDVSLALIEAAGPDKDARILDVGGGASTLVDHLLAAGHTSLAVLDISGAALAHARARIGADAERVEWVAADITRWQPREPVELWHDRAVLHFLTASADQHAYADVLRATVKPCGWVIVAGFAPGGPLKCSGLEIVQHDAGSLGALLGEEFRLIEIRDETHQTPWGSDQAFRYHLFWRG